MKLVPSEVIPKPQPELPVTRTLELDAPLDLVVPPPTGRGSAPPYAADGWSAAIPIPIAAPSVSHEPDAPDDVVDVKQYALAVLAGIVVAGLIGVIALGVWMLGRSDEPRARRYARPRPRRRGPRAPRSCSA